MKTTAAIRRFAFALVLLVAAALPEAGRAAFVLDVAQVDNSVVFTGAGTLDLTDLSFSFSTTGLSIGVAPDKSFAQVGVSSGSASFYTGTITGPASFGPGNFAVTTVGGTGELVGIAGAFDQVRVPEGYVSGTPLAGGLTITSSTFATLGITPGTYTYTWGSGLDADSFTIMTSIGAIPEPSTWALVGVGAAGLGVVTLRRRAARA